MQAASPSLQRSSRMEISRNIRIGELLVSSEMITQEQLDDALAMQKDVHKGKKLGDILIEENMITEDDFVSVLHKKLRVPIVNLETTAPSAEALATLTRDKSAEYSVLPLSVTDDELTLVMSNPVDYYTIDDIALITRKVVNPVLSTKSGIISAIDRFYSATMVTTAADSVNKEYSDIEDVVNASFLELESRVSSAPVVQLVNALINQAHRMRASDIHIEPTASHVLVRFRIDGDLTEVVRLNLSVHGTLVTRLKIMGDMDIAEKRLPQDGRFETLLGGASMNIRVASMPTVFGEKVVLRLLGSNKAGILRLTDLGMLPVNLERLNRLLRSPNGIILVTGPTGSGKTTTLYAALCELAKPNVNVISVEDPVEKTLKGMNQLQINDKAGMTFASALRAILRQDPDIIMVGEIRDSQTAEIAARAAITGHLVLSTVHTQDACSTFTRIIDMGVEPYMAASSIVGVVSQRLVKLLCEHCKQEHIVTSADKLLFKELQIGEKIYKPKGCAKCNGSGYIGRTAVHEVLIVNQEIRELVARNATVNEIRKEARLEGITLRNNVLVMVRQGKTTFDEMIRLTFSLEA